ncbi:MAG: hypothetical protein L0210_07215 [Rhodospirillales bacterium]|nr:hypothetical protein [Rhodospirillales bacterium]
MSQKKKESTPPMGDLPPVVQDAVAPPAQVSMQHEAVAEQEPTSTIIEVPLGPLHEGGYLSDHISARLSSLKQRRNYRRLLNGLRNSGATLENGRFVHTQADAMKWLFENLE